MSNLSEKEKYAIKELTEIKELVEEDLQYDHYEVTATLNKIDLKSLVIVLNLIEKQQVEINKEKEKNKNLQDKCIELEEENIKIKHLMRNPCDIPRQIIIEKMNKDINTNEHTILGGRRNGKTLEYGIRLGRIQMCEELLEEGDDK